MKRSGLVHVLLCGGALLASGAALGQDVLQDSGATTQTDAVAAAEFELATVGSGAPEVFVWFGPDERSADASRLAERRALVDRLRADVEPGTGRFHVLVSAGPKGAAEVAFDRDFPRMELPSEDASEADDAVFQRQDSRALASYLTREAAGGAGPVLMVRASSAATDAGAQVPTPRGLERFARRGMGMGLAHFPWQPPAGEELAPALDAARDVLFAHRAAVRLGLTAGELVQLGGDLFQVDLTLAGLGALPDPATLDPRRTYARSRLALGLTSTLVAPPENTPEIEATSDSGAQRAASAGAVAEAVELALQPTSDAPFERLPKRAAAGERFVLDRSQEPRTLRLVLRIPAGVERVELTLDSSRFGAARVSLARPVPKGPEPSGDGAEAR